MDLLEKKYKKKYSWSWRYKGDHTSGLTSRKRRVTSGQGRRGCDNGPRNCPEGKAGRRETRHCNTGTTSVTNAGGEGASHCRAHQQHAQQEHTENLHFISVVSRGKIE
jgi:hypothetical protein